MISFSRMTQLGLELIKSCHAHYPITIVHLISVTILYICLHYAFVLFDSDKDTVVQKY